MQLTVSLRRTRGSILKSQSRWDGHPHAFKLKWPTHSLLTFFSSPHRKELGRYRACWKHNWLHSFFPEVLLDRSLVVPSTHPRDVCELFAGPSTGKGCMRCRKDSNEIDFFEELLTPSQFWWKGSTQEDLRFGNHAPCAPFSGDIVQSLKPHSVKSASE